MTPNFKRFILSAGFFAFVASVLQPAGVWGADAPVFGPKAKLVSGRVSSPSGKNVATDGTSFYMTMLIEGSDGGSDRITVARIPNGGGAPEVTGTALTRPAGQLTDQLALAVSDSSSTAKTVHLLWSEQGDNRPGLYYSRSSDPKLAEWSAPVRINGSNSHVTSFSIVANNKGDRQVIFIGDGPKIYYTKAAAGDSVFSEPVALPGTPLYEKRGGVNVALDRDGALHVAFMATDEPGYDMTERVGLQYTVLLPGAKKWSTPVDVIPITAIAEKGYTAIAAADSRSIFIASSLDRTKRLEVYQSQNGGALWTKSIVATGRVHNQPGIAIAPDGTVTVASGFETASDMDQEVRVFRSSDGSAWSPAVIVPDATSAVIVMDGKGKAAVFTRGSGNVDMRYVVKEK